MLSFLACHPHPLRSIYLTAVDIIRRSHSEFFSNCWLTRLLPCSHIAHHLSSKIPHHNAWKATAALKEFLGQHYSYTDENMFASLWKVRSSSSLFRMSPLELRDASVNETGPLLVQGSCPFQLTRKHEMLTSSHLHSRAVLQAMPIRRR